MESSERHGLERSGFALVDTWAANDHGVLRLPSGRLVRGRAVRRRNLSGAQPEFGIYLLATPPDSLPWDTRWVRWRDFRLPTDPYDAHDALCEAWRRSNSERVELACNGGRGRTGTALACLAVLDGVPALAAVSYVREHYARRAVETPWQRRFVQRFAPHPDNPTFPEHHS